MKSAILFIFFALSLMAKSPPKNDPYFIPGMKFSKSELLKFLKKESPQQFCDEKNYFIKCYDVVVSNCPEEINGSFDDCAKTVRIPAEIDVLEINDYSAKLGDCVGSDLEKKWVERKKGSRECKKRF